MDKRFPTQSLESKSEEKEAGTAYLADDDSQSRISSSNLRSLLFPNP